MHARILPRTRKRAPAPACTGSRMKACSHVRGCMHAGTFIPGMEQSKCSHVRGCMHAGAFIPGMEHSKCSHVRGCMHAGPFIPGMEQSKRRCARTRQDACLHTCAHMHAYTHTHDTCAHTHTRTHACTLVHIRHDT